MNAGQLEVIQSIKPFLAVAISMAAAILILLTGRNKDIREMWTIIASIGKFSIVFSMLPDVISGKIIEFTLAGLSPQILLQFRVDAFGIFFALLSSGLWIVTSIYSIGYMRGLREHAQTRYFFCFAIALSATMGIAFAGNLLTFFIFYEILTIATYPLVLHKESKEAIVAGRKYLAYTLTGGVFLLFSIGMTYSLAGSLNFVPGGFLAQKGSAEVLRILFITFILGCGVKAAFIPVHEWLPTAMIAPTPVSALLHAVAVVKAGVFGVLRIVCFVFGPELLLELNLWIILAYFASITIVVASMYALAQDNLKRRLAYSTISQLSYIVLGAALLSPSALTGGILHIANHAFTKITLFFCAGAIYVKTHKENISELDGIGRQMPVTMGAFAVGAMGLVGIPPINGFISKWYLGLGSLEAHEIFFLFVLLVSSLLNVAYFFPIIYNSFFKLEKSSFKNKIDEASPAILLPIVVTALFSIFYGIFPDAFTHFYGLSRIVVRAVLGGI